MLGIYTKVGYFSKSAIFFIICMPMVHRTEINFVYIDVYGRVSKLANTGQMI
jgi:hypothetical protein